MFYFSALTGTFPSCYQFNLRGKKKKKGAIMLKIYKLCVIYLVML